MSKRKKRWTEMTTDDLAAATRSFDDVSFDPPARKPPPAEIRRLARAQAKAKNQRLRIAIALEGNLVEQTDNYAASRGISFFEVVSDALRSFIRKKSA